MERLSRRGQKGGLRALAKNLIVADILRSYKAGFCIISVTLMFTFGFYNSKRVRFVSQVKIVKSCVLKFHLCKSEYVINKTLTNNNTEKLKSHRKILTMNKLLVKQPKMIKFLKSFKLISVIVCKWITKW